MGGSLSKLGGMAPPAMLISLALLVVRYRRLLTAQQNSISGTVVGLTVSRLIENQVGTLIESTWDSLVRMLYFQAVVKSEQAAFRWLMEYLAFLHQKTAIDSHSVQVFVNSVDVYWEKGKYSDANVEEQMVSYREKPQLLYVPGEGNHSVYVPDLGDFIHFYIENDCITVSYLVLAGGGHQKLEKLLDLAREYSFSQDVSKTCVYILDSYQGWTKTLSRNPRSWDSVILDEGIAQSVYDDLMLYMSKKRADWYATLGIPYRRAYLLTGPPGSGKTSFVQALAGRAELDIAVLSLNGISDDVEFAKSLRTAPQHCILLLEDIDAAFPSREWREEKKRRDEEDDPYGLGSSSSTGITLSGLLNAIDGLVAQEGRVIFMTTNHPEHLDPALLRPGRCDVVVNLDLASENQVMRMFLRFFPTARPTIAHEFAAAVGGGKVSMASLQGHLMMYSDPEEALQQWIVAAAKREAELAEKKRIREEKKREKEAKKKEEAAKKKQKEEEKKKRKEAGEEVSDEEEEDGAEDDFD